MTETETRIRNYFKGYACYFFEEDKVLYLDKNSISLLDLRVIAEILDTDNIEFCLHDGIKSKITWEYEEYCGDCGTEIIGTHGCCLGYE